ncbi:MAG: fumarylacetoacetate hydrolase family protein [Pseudomonadota bacterium]
MESVQVSLSDQDDEISKRLVDARLGAKVLPGFPGEIPDSLHQAYGIQFASIERWPDKVAGWKIGLLSPADRQKFSAERLAGPIFDSQIKTIVPDSSNQIQIYHGGFAAVEAEFVLEIGVDVPPVDTHFTDEDLKDIVAALYVGIEIASSPMADINKLGPPVVVSDFGNNAGLLLGPSVEDWRSRSLDSMVAKVFVDGELVGDASADAIPGGPLQALRFLLGLKASQGMTLPAGTLVSTGASTGIHDVTISSRARVEFGACGGFELTFESVTSKQ